MEINHSCRRTSFYLIRFFLCSIQSEELIKFTNPNGLAQTLGISGVGIIYIAHFIKQAIIDHAIDPSIDIIIQNLKISIYPQETTVKSGVIRPAPLVLATNNLI
jgi:hypothetical protein